MIQTVRTVLRLIITTRPINWSERTMAVQAGAAGIIINGVGVTRELWLRLRLTTVHVHSILPPSA